MADMAQVVDNLLQRTLQNKIWWKPTAIETSFAAVVGSFSAVVSLHEHPGEIDMEPRLRVLDREGKEIDRYDASTVGASQVTSDKLGSLYKSARRVALNVDQQLDGLLGELGQTSPH